MPGEDEIDSLLKKLRGARRDMEREILGGQISVENVTKGYHYCVGYLEAMKRADEMVRDAFRGWLAPEPGATHRDVSEY